MVKELIIHPDYSPKRIFNNLAILITESNFVYQKHIGPVCLPKPNENFEGQVKNIYRKYNSHLSNLFFIFSQKPLAGQVVGVLIRRE